MSRRIFALLVATVVAAALAAATTATARTSDTTLSLVAYSVPRDALGAVIKAWQQTPDGKAVDFTQSYGASGDQARAVAAGLKADVVQLSTGLDVDLLVKAGLVDRSWDKQTVPAGVHEMTLAELEAACRAAARVGRKGDAGYIVACDVRENRDSDHAGPAGFVLIDQDEGAAEPDWAALDQYQGFAWTTASHRPDKPSWRVVIPLITPIAHGKIRSPFRGAAARRSFVARKNRRSFTPIAA